MKKRIISAFAAIAMAAAVLPVAPVSAAEPEPILCYTFDGENPLASENGKNELILSGGASVTDDGNTGKALLLDGTDGFAQLPSGIMSQNMTISAWVKMTRLNAWGRMFDFGTDANNNFFFAPYSGGAARVEIKTPSGVDTMDTADNTNRDVWEFYTVVIDNGTAKYYKNGRLIASKTGLTQPLTDVKDELNYIGKSHYDGDAYFAGAVDDFCVYDKALTHQEIVDRMGHGFIDYETLLDTYAIEDGQMVFGDTLELPGFYSGTQNSANSGGVYWECDDKSIVASNEYNGGGFTLKFNRPQNTTEIKLRECALIGDVGKYRDYTAYIAGTNEAPFTVDIDAADLSKDVSDNMWGLFFEDINSAADGGLYAEMIQNRSFETERDEHLYSWEIDGDAKINTKNPMNENNPTYITLGKDASITNDGYMGMSVKKDAVYNFSVRVRGNADLTVSVGGASVEVKADGADWQEVTATITAAESASDAKLIVKNSGEAVDVDMISLMPQDTYKGHGLRKDLMEALEAMHPKYLRFPGGCAVEGNTMDLAWNWKDTIGDPSERKEMMNIWNAGAPAEPYMMTYGLGFYEYFQMCEDLGMEPIPILNCGLSCQVRSGGNEDENHVVPMGDLQPYIDDALDLIAFANGLDENNKWTRIRMDMGHKESFNLKYIGIGNEQYGEIYFERYAEFAKQIHEKYPDINLVTTSGTASSGNNNNLAWNWANENQEYADFMDEHYYESPDWFLNHAYRYDNYRRDTNTKVFLGEYASKGNTWYNAMAEAAYMTGLERNADVVRMASYAPMFAKYGNTQWAAANMIWFNNNDYVLTPDYYVQKLFSTNTGDYTLTTKTSLNGIPAEDYFHGGVVLGSWGTQNEFKDMAIMKSDNVDVVAPVWPKADKWEKGVGEWSIGKDGVISQTGALTGSTIYNDLGGELNKNYTFTVKAKKNGGGEGFQIGVAAEDAQNYYRVNIGGWSNTTAKIQHIVNGVSADEGSVAEQSYAGEVHINDGEWYDVTVEMTDYEIKAYLNGEFICSYTKPKSYGPVYASSTYDEETGEIIAKIVNTADADTEVQINLNNAKIESAAAKTITMSADTDAVNTLENKNNVVPVEGTFNGAAESFVYPVKANSLNIIRIAATPYNISDNGVTYITGYPDGTFKPDNTVTRAEAAAIFARVLPGFSESKEYEGKTAFSDVAENAWYKNYVNCLAAQGILDGYPDGTFRPENTVTRAEIIAMICKYLHISPNGYSRYTDMSGHWAEGYVAALEASKEHINILGESTDTPFRPDDAATRAEVVYYVNRMLKRGQRGDAVNPFSDVDKSHWAYADIIEAAATNNAK